MAERTSPSVLDAPPFDPQMVSLIAAELGDPFDIAAEFGIAASQFAKLRETPAYQAALTRAKQELEESGYSAEYAELLTLQEALPGMVKDIVARFHAANTTTDQKIKIFELTNKVLAERRARLAPKKSDTPAGPGFSISIVFDNNAAPGPARAAVTIEGTATEVDE